MPHKLFTCEAAIGAGIQDFDQEVLGFGRSRLPNISVSEKVRLMRLVLDDVLNVSLFSSIKGIHLNQHPIHYDAHAPVLAPMVTGLGETLRRTVPHSLNISDLGKTDFLPFLKVCE